MIQVAFDAAGFTGVCTGIAAVIGSVSALVWACRRDPKGGGGNERFGSGHPRLPPAE